MAVFLRLLWVDDKATALARAARDSQDRLRYVVVPHDLAVVPTSPFAYWVRPNIRAHFTVKATDSWVAKQGLATAYDFRFVRCWYEVAASSITAIWFPMVKGGRRSSFYRDVGAVANWERNGFELRNFVNPENGKQRSRTQNVEFYFREGISWPLRGIRFSAQAVPAGCVFSIAGKMAFGPRSELGSRLAIMNSEPYDRLMGLFAGKVGGVQYESGLVDRTPIPHLNLEDRALYESLARAGWSARRALDTAVEVSHAFVVPALLQVHSVSFGDRASAWSARAAEVENDMARVQASIDELCFELYGIPEGDRRTMAEGFGVAGAGADADADGEDVDDDEDETALVELDPAGLAAGLVSWAVGVAVGRFDVRLGTGERGWPVEPDLFDPLPVCSPGMLTGDNELPVGEPPAGYPVSVSPVMVDDPGHPLDATGRVRSVFDAVFGVDADEWWSAVGEALGSQNGEIGGWLTKGFFDYHLKTYSRSRRKAPVLWPIGTKSGSYVVWLYAHQVSADSLFQVLHDVVAPKLAVEERGLTRLRQEAGVNPSLSQRKAIDMQEQLVGELRELREELEAVAPLWAPDLNDGIVIVLAPLWRLFAHHRPWSNELKKHWTKLAKGDYDWAQLAMHLWPERVIPKCAVDRSLAIAHNLEDTFWVKDVDNVDKWHSRAKPTTPIDQLISEHHNPAVAASIRRGTT